MAPQVAPMPTDDIAALSPDELPLPFGIQAETGTPLPGLTVDDLAGIRSDDPAVNNRGARGGGAHLAIEDVDANDLSQAGWAVVFAEDVDPAVKAALQPLLAHRERQAGALFNVFDGTEGVRPGDTAKAWVERHGAGMSIVDPANGVPVYLLLVGSPAEIPFEFQYLLDLYWNVGRLHFDRPEDYTAYAEHVVAHETGATVPLKKRSAMFAVKNAGDRPTGLLHNQVALPLATGAGGVRPLADVQGFKLSALLGADATKERLAELLRGPEAPAFLFTGSHGVAFAADDSAQREKQGAILCQDWPGFGPTKPEHLFTADDVPADANVHGLIHFLFACYGGGCPKEDNFGLASGKPPRPLIADPIVARLPQRLLTRGALASLAHVDRAWNFSFQNSRSAPQVQEMRDVMVRLLKGQRVGQATDAFNMRWAVLGAELQESLNQREAFDRQLVSDAALAHRYIARNDARNYIVIGDPAVQLRPDVMAQ
jgi:hypothetical protein